jgi:hypothetical protein
MVALVQVEAVAVLALLVLMLLHHQVLELVVQVHQVIHLGVLLQKLGRM